jgi:hypothetical protein
MTFHSPAGLPSRDQVDLASPKMMRENRAHIPLEVSRSKRRPLSDRERRWIC